jgi:hypothetical protein
MNWEMVGWIVCGVAVVLCAGVVWFTIWLTKPEVKNEVGNQRAKK